MTQVLDLTAALERDTVKLSDGTTVELRNPQEFGLLEEHRMRALMKRANEFHGKTDPSDGDVQEASAVLEEIASMLIIGDKTVAEWELLAIFEFWMKKAVPGGGDADPPPKRPTTGGSSRGSKRSTAATRKRGSTSRRTR